MLRLNIGQRVPLEVGNDVICTSNTVRSTDDSYNLCRGESDFTEALEDAGDVVERLGNEPGGCRRDGLRAAHKEWNPGSSRALDKTDCTRELNAMNICLSF